VFKASPWQTGRAMYLNQTTSLELGSLHLGGCLNRTMLLRAAHFGHRKNMPALQQQRETVWWLPLLLEGGRLKWKGLVCIRPTRMDLKPSPVASSDFLAVRF